MKCPSCGSSAVLYDQLRGEQICTRCGLVIVERLPEPGPEWRPRPSEEVGRADVTAGVDVTQHDLGLGSKLILSHDLSPSWRARLRRMQLWQRRSRASTWGERSLREALIELDKLCGDLGLSKEIRAEVSLLYRKARAARLTFGRGTLSVLTALTFVACRLRGIPRTEGELVRVLKARAGLQERVALRTLRQFVKILTEKMGLRVPRLMPEDYLNKFASQLKLSEQTTARAHEIYNALPKRLRGTKSPTLLAAAVLYVAAGETGAGVPIRELAATAGVGISSLSKNAKLVRELAASRAG